MVAKVLAAPRSQGQTAIEPQSPEKEGRKESQSHPCRVEKENLHTSECHVDGTAGAPGAGLTLRLTSLAPPLAGAVAVGEEGRLPLEGYVCF